ncbi:MAG: DsbA family protein [Hyphomonadaceae bacterium]|nr:MAG: disulfide isomerase [Caulobacteraceae bacterium]MBT9446497.1 DsbA family protein [Hyphomonadaceae bacterium]TPW07925.1 MAG: disulfide isomerase [Alphaproteobacteria bacterium]
MLMDRRTLLLSSAALSLLAACEGGGKPAVSSADMALGPEDAKVTVIEYASLACHVCKDFHADIWPQLKANYIDTGKIRFIFREFPTGQPQIAAAEHLLARCMSSTPDQYFKAVEMFFEQQTAVFEAAGANQVREKLLELARTGGLSEEQFTQCIADPEQVARLNKVAEEGDKQFKITGTPTIIINGAVIENTAANPYTYERLSKLIDEKLAAG